MIRFRATLVFDADQHMSASYLKRCLADALRAEVTRVEGDDPLSAVDITTIRVEKASGVRLGAAAPTPPALCSGDRVTTPGGTLLTILTTNSDGSATCAAADGTSSTWKLRDLKKASRLASADIKAGGYVVANETEPFVVKEWRPNGNVIVTRRDGSDQQTWNHSVLRASTSDEYDILMHRKKA